MPRTLEAETVRDRLDDDVPVAVIDIRPTLDYTDGHIEWCTRVPRRALERRLPRLVPNRTTEVVLVDREGDRGARDAAWLEHLGYESVAHLDGGMAAWLEAGLPVVEAIDGVPNTAYNVPSKRFGERVHVERDVPALSPDEFAALRAEDDVVVVDVRTPEEHRAGAIPDAINLEGVNLARNLPALRDGDEPVVVHCAGRTRSIIGTATLRRMGLEDVYELENGTMGWQLAGYEVERGSTRHVVDPDLDEDDRAELEGFADELLAEHGIPRIPVREFEADLADGGVTYAVDVRSAAEYRGGHVPGTLSIPGGQAIQTADEHFAVHPADIVFVSETYLRAAVTAYWFAEMGFSNVAVLDGGIEAWTAAGNALEEGEAAVDGLGTDIGRDHVDLLSPPELANRIDVEGVSVLDIDASWRFADRHVPGASWVDRYDLDATLEGPDKAVVLTCRDGSISAMAGAALGWERGRSYAVLDGGVDAWIEAGKAAASGGPERAVRDDFEKPWDQGEGPMRAYLQWEVEMGREFVG